MIKKTIIITSILLVIGTGSYYYFVNRNRIKNMFGIPNFAFSASPDAYQTIRDAEGLRLNAYQNKGDVPTIGYGYTWGVKLGDTITVEKAEELLSKAIHYFESRINAKPINLNQNQYDAVLTFMYQFGEGNFFQSPMYAKIKVNPNDSTIPDEFLKYAYKARRQQEAELYATPVIITA